jgi:DNA repair protein RecN (Recombination protein N)
MKSFDSYAATLSEKRKSAAAGFDKQIMREIHALNMKDAQFKTTFEHSDIRRQDGFDKVEFMISTNPGQPLRPLKKVVSGGELSRIMLSIKLILGKLDGIPSLVFDEVDTGISGKTASVVGEKLQKIAGTHQVICVTHLPQIAVMADHHLFIEKQTQAEDTVSSVRPLGYDERIDEIGRLIGGDTITNTTRVHAVELLELARKRKLSS